MDTAAYLRRIGFDGTPRADVDTLRAVQAAHLAAVPYENLDIQLGTPPSIAPAAIFDKIVRCGRGGYCYELNGGLGHLLAAVGFRVTRIMAAVHFERWGDRAWGNHMALLVDLDGDRWLADVGFGDGIHEPIPLRVGTYGREPFRYGLERRGKLWRLVHHQWGTAPDFYFTTTPRALGDFTPHHARLSTSPESSFVKLLVVQQARRDHVATLRGALLTRSGPAGRENRELTGTAEFAALLADDFGIRLDGLDVRRLWAGARAQTDAWLAAQSDPPRRAHTGRLTSARTAR